MLTTLLKSKLHHAIVTDVELEYEGSLEIDCELMKLAGILHGEQIHVFNINNGQRFTTYAVKGPVGSGRFRVMGAAARLVEKGDQIIVVTYGQYSDDELDDYCSNVVVLDSNNKPKS
jgi:aspartate 1-decarboxylase